MIDGNMKQKIDKTNRMAAQMNKAPPFIVKSVLVVNAYIVRATVTANVIRAAQSTNSPPLEKAS